MKNKRIWYSAITVLILLGVLLIGPLNVFRHGHYVEEYYVRHIAPEDWQQQIPVETGVGYEMQFSPVKDFMNGFSIFLCNQPEKATGTLTLKILIEDKLIDEVSVKLKDVEAGQWYKVSTNKYLKKGVAYTLRFEAEGYKEVPLLQNVLEDYLPDETLTGNTLLAYSYAQPTFSIDERVLIVILLISLWLFVSSKMLDLKKKDYMRLVSICGFATALLAWVYTHNSLDTKNIEKYNEFQMNSETLVSNMIEAEHNGVYFSDDSENGYGLGRYYDFIAEKDDYIYTFLTDDTWVNGYSRKAGDLLVDSNLYTKSVILPGNTIEFSNGDRFEIVGINDDGDNIFISLGESNPLMELKYGSLNDIRIYDEDGKELPRGYLEVYLSQYGLQGKIFRHIARHVDYEDALPVLHLICGLLTALVLVLVTYVLYRKYNTIFAGCFIVTAFLGAYIVDYARNLYWVEFTWFLPMLFGLICAWKLNNKKSRILCYIGAFISITVKCLCGYEYITTIMMAMIAFLLVDAVVAFSKKDKDVFKLCVRTIVIIGVAALLGFFVAICIHASLKGQGDIVKGIGVIIKDDVLRRTSALDLNQFPEVYESLNTSSWAVLCKYFKLMPTVDILVGVPGNLFPVYCVAPICIMFYDYKKNKLNIEELSLYVVFFLTTVSWFLLAKGHADVHPELCFGLWYVGYVQVCLYIMVKKIAEVAKGRTGAEK
ncbi:hypothetical protein [Pseudobutyrivibrio sp. MD2005]|uniref:hypothetical protein n=1 Tax=Pseudobutyrivibrio sp. MD2005 TaxID=1410616 RepID=UPI000481F90F|nr:hypothetical protein [Pseudobutyrivibrio sp. MD2005]